MANNIREKVLTKVLRRLRGRGYEEPDQTTNEMLEDLIEESEQKIINYCHISEVPIELIFTWTNMVVDYFVYINTFKDIREQSGDSEGGDIDVKPVMGNLRSIKEGDTVIEAFDRADTEDYQRAYRDARIMSKTFDDFLYNYKGELQEFRRLY